MILAAGLGTRLKPLTDKTPKPMVRIGGKPILWHILKWLFDHDIWEDVCINVHHLPLQIMDYFGIAYRYSGEARLLGTAGALKRIGEWEFFWDTEVDDGNLLVVNGDTITNLDPWDMLRVHKTEGNIATIFTKDTALHNGGVFIFNKKVLDYIPKGKPFSIHEDLLPDLIKKKIPISLYKSDAYYFDCGTPEKLEKARKFFKG